MKLRVILLVTVFFPGLLFAKDFSAYGFVGYSQKIPANIQAKMKQYTWRKGCPTPLQDLRYLRLSYYGFDHRRHIGAMIVNKTVATDVISIFKQLYLHRFQIQSMKPMYLLKGKQAKALALNNTSSFNCRWVTGRKGKFSKHSYGLAIDVNPKTNPYLKKGSPNPNRYSPKPGAIVKGGLIYRLFKSHGWTWGGDWRRVKDYHHFEK